MKGNKVFWFLVMLLILAIGLMLLPSKVGAEDGYPKGVQVFSVEDHTCVLFIDTANNISEMECFCPCDQDCEVSKSQPTLTPTDKPKDKPTPTNPPPSPEPTPDPPKPTPKKNKEKCNAGRGNGSEGNPDCDPGNSGGKNKGGD